LVDRVLGAWEANDNEEAEPGQKRKGYMGQLTRIENLMVIIYSTSLKNDKKNPVLVNLSVKAN